LTELGVGEAIYDLRKQIQKITFELENLENDSKNIPELISSTNLLRSNDHLVEINHKKSELISTYMKYSDQLEQMLATVFEIQKELKEILKMQSSLLSKSRSVKKAKPKKKSKK
jgi:DNA repair ATPase RecN